MSGPKADSLAVPLMEPMCASTCCSLSFARLCVCKGEGKESSDILHDESHFNLLSCEALAPKILSHRFRFPSFGGGRRFHMQQEQHPVRIRHLCSSRDEGGSKQTDCKDVLELHFEVRLSKSMPLGTPVEPPEATQELSRLLGF